jgi:hypothetical protein
LRTEGESLESAFDQHLDPLLEALAGDDLRLPGVGRVSVDEDGEEFGTGPQLDPVQLKERGSAQGGRLLRRATHHRVDLLPGGRNQRGRRATRALHGARICLLLFGALVFLNEHGLLRGRQAVVILLGVLTD